MRIQQDFIPTGRENRPGIRMAPQWITIHDTANPDKGADALMHAKYLKGDDAAKRPASWHFTVDDQRIIQHLPLDEVGWHAGDGRNGPGNTSSIGIEICENEDGDRQKAEENAAWLVANLLKRFGLGIDAVVQHNHWSGKDCPHIIRARPGGWDEFIAKVKKYLEQKEVPKVEQKQDVSTWAREAQEWVKEKGISDGERPKDPVTREELWTMLWRMNKK